MRLYLAAMRHPPAFWRQDAGAMLPSLLAPLSGVVAGVTAWRMRRDGWVAPIPVICVGNVTVGGAGKTTVALDLVHRLLASRHHPHVLLRGYGGRVRGPHWVRPDDQAEQVGDEALLYAPLAPTWTGGDRALSAQAAVAAGADVLVMDDGLQNPGLHKQLSLLVIDGGSGFGNGRVLPAGPLREPVARAAARCQAAVLIGDDATGAMARLPPNLPVLYARLLPAPRSVAVLAGQPVLAFTGIAVPEKFFASLTAIGARIVARRAFPDHHLFNPRERDALLAEAERLGAIPVTTAKDAARLPKAERDRVSVLEIALTWQDESRIDELIARTVDPPSSIRRCEADHA